MHLAMHDSHSSRRIIAHALELSTRWQREPRLLPAYLILLRMEVTAFHRNLIRSSLWPYSSPHGVRPLAVILLFAARTFLPSSKRAATAWPALVDYNILKIKVLQLIYLLLISHHQRLLRLSLRAILLIHFQQSRSAPQYRPWFLHSL